MNTDKSSATIKEYLEENLDKAVNYIPDKFTILVYNALDRISPKIKTGDSIHKVNELPFLMNKAVEYTTLVI